MDEVKTVDSVGADVGWSREEIVEIFAVGFSVGFTAVFTVGMNVGLTDEEALRPQSALSLF